MGRKRQQASQIDGLRKQVEFWQKAIATHLMRQYSNQTSSQLDSIVRAIIIAIVCLYLAEQRKILSAQRLQTLQGGEAVYARLVKLWHHFIYTLDQNLDQALINFVPPALNLDDRLLQSIIQSLYQSVAHSHEILSIEILGQVYEWLLRGVATVSTTTQRTKINSPTSKKTGAYYTPVTIVDYMVQNTLSVLFPSQSHHYSTRHNSKAALPLPGSLPHILDPACGSGIFLLKAYQFLLNWQLQCAIQTYSQTHQNHSENDTQNAIEHDGLLKWGCTGWQLTLAARTQVLHHIYGVDIDPQAVIVTQLSLWLTLLEGTFLTQQPSTNWRHNIQCGNALIGRDCSDKTSYPFDWQTAFPDVMATGGFDAVIGNPPYVDSEWMTLHLPHWRRYCTTHYRSATGNWDLFCIFIEKAINLCRPGGYTSLIVPNKLASADYAAKARSLLVQETQLLAIRDYSQVPVFSVAVYPLVYLARKRHEIGDSQIAQTATQVTVQYEQMQTIDRVGLSHALQFADPAITPEVPWLAISEPQACLINRLQQNFPTLATHAQVTAAATVAEAYALSALLQNSPAVQPEDLRLVNSGTIDRYRFLWGEKPLRYLGHSYQYPVIYNADCDRLPPKRYQQAKQPKIIVAGMSRRLECAVDLAGSILAGKSTVVIRLAPLTQSQTQNASDGTKLTLGQAIDLRYLLGLLNSQLVSFYFACCFCGNALQGGYLRVGAPQLRQLPVALPTRSGQERENDAYPNNYPNNYPNSYPNNCQNRSSLDHNPYRQMIALVNQMLGLQQQINQQPTENSAAQESLQQRISQVDARINQLVYQLYDLTDREIETVHNWRL